MKFENEEDFRSWIHEELSKQLGEKWIVLHAKNVSDIIVCRNASEKPFAAFIEVKYHKSMHGRIGFGSGKGKGFQPEILERGPLYFEKYMRWVIADNDSEKYLFFSNAEVRKNSAGGKIEKGKQNNFVYGLFEKNANITSHISDCPLRVAEWLESIAT